MVVTCANNVLLGEFAAIKKFKNEVRFHTFNAQSPWHANKFLSWVKISGKHQTTFDEEREVPLTLSRQFLEICR